MMDQRYVEKVVISQFSKICSMFDAYRIEEQRNISFFKQFIMLKSMIQPHDTSLLDSHLGEHELTLEGFPLPFASPDTQNQWNLSTNLRSEIHIEHVSVHHQPEQ